MAGRERVEPLPALTISRIFRLDTNGILQTFRDLHVLRRRLQRRHARLRIFIEHEEFDKLSTNFDGLLRFPDTQCVRVARACITNIQTILLTVRGQIRER